MKIINHYEIRLDEWMWAPELYGVFAKYRNKDTFFFECRRVLYADEIRAYDSTEEIANRLLSFVMDGGELFSYPQLLQDITVGQVQELLQSVFQRERMAVSVVVPLEEQ